MVPRRRLWRLFFWIALIAIIVEVLGLTSTFIELRRRRAGDLPGLGPDQIAAVARLWPSLQASQRKDVLSAISGAGLSYRVTSESPLISPADAHVREVENAVRKRLGEASADSVVAIIHARPFGRERRAI